MGFPDASRSSSAHDVGSGCYAKCCCATNR